MEAEAEAEAVQMLYIFYSKFSRVSINNLENLNVSQKRSITLTNIGRSISNTQKFPTDSKKFPSSAAIVQQKNLDR